LPAAAAPILDGMRDVSYELRSVQTVETQFGDGNPNGGSELDAAYAWVEGGTLYLMLTGNLENNFNKLNVFIDSRAGGENVLTNDANFGGNNPANDGWAAKYAGFAFDTGFDADYLLILRNGNVGGDRFDVDFAVVGGGRVRSRRPRISLAARSMARTRMPCRWPASAWPSTAATRPASWAVPGPPTKPLRPPS